MAMPKCLALIVLACSIAGQALALARTRGAQGIGDAAPSSWVSQQGC